MGKRLAPKESDQEYSPAKRLKLTESTVNGEQKCNEIRSSKDLHGLLRFIQEELPRLKLNLHIFRSFLGDVGSELKQGSQGPKCSIFLEFLKSSTPAEDDNVSESLPDLFQAWRFACQVKNHALMSAIPNVLAFLLQTISTAIDFRLIGSRLCKTVFIKENVALLDEGLSSAITKAHLLAPCLRLLIEVVSFDGGVHARSVYQQKEVAFKRLDVFLSVHSAAGKPNQSSAASSVRRLALEYFCLNIRFQDTVAKTDLLSQAKVARAVFQDVATDSKAGVLDLLATLKVHVLGDHALPKFAKSRLLTDVNLRQIVALYNVDDSGLSGEDERPVQVADLAHDFLVLACTSRKQGIAFKQNGWYPPGTEDKILQNDMSASYDFSRKQEAQEDFRRRVPVRNTSLASLLSDLRPWAQSKEKALAVVVFRACPELVADYFKRKQSFNFEPKLSMTWLGYSSFLFSVIKLPLLAFDTKSKGVLGFPPPASVALESILPGPLNAKVLKKCINHKNGLVKLISLRILVAAFQKMQDLIFRLSASDIPPQWKSWLSQITHEFKARVPDLSSVTNVYKTSKKGQSILTDVAACLLALYHTALPQALEDDKFDVSTYLTDLLRADSNELSTGYLRPPCFEVNYLLEIANSSIESRWWHKPEKLPLSPFTLLLRATSQAGQNAHKMALEFLQQVVDEKGILQHDRGIASLSALIRSLKPFADWTPGQALFEFLDNCVLRLIQKPVKYLGDLEKLLQSSTVKKPVSAIFMVLLEQWPFYWKGNTETDIREATIWLVRLLKLAILEGENDELLEMFERHIAPTAWLDEAKAFLESAPVDDPVNEVSISQPGTEKSPPPEKFQHGMAEKENREVGREMLRLDKLLQIPAEPEEYPSLISWQKKDMADVVEGSELGNLIHYLSSYHEEIRRQALIQLRHLMLKLQSSNYHDRQQVYLLVGIIVHTAEETITAEPLPSVGSVLGARLTHVLSNPLHCLYAKANEFLGRSPTWNYSKIPTYWIDKVLLLPPEHSDAHLEEVTWVLETLLRGLRTEADLDLYRRSSVFERVMSLTTSPRLPTVCFTSVVYLLYRCILIGGATTLVTRCGILAWVQEKLASEFSNTLLLRCLNLKITEGYKHSAVTGWNGSN